MKKTCQFCSVQVTTYVEHEVNPFFGISALLIFIVFGFLGLIIVPFVYFVTKNAVHRCSRCLSKMGEKRCFGLPDDFKSPVSTNRPLLYIDMASTRRQMLYYSRAYLRFNYPLFVRMSLRVLCVYAAKLPNQLESFAPP